MCISIAIWFLQCLVRAAYDYLSESQMLGFSNRGRSLPGRCQSRQGEHQWWAQTPLTLYSLRIKWNRCQGCRRLSHFHPIMSAQDASSWTFTSQNWYECRILLLSNFTVLKRPLANRGRSLSWFLQIRVELDLCLQIWGRWNWWLRPISGPSAYYETAVRNRTHFDHL